MTREVVYVLHGDRDIAHYQQSVRSVREYLPGVPIRVWHNTDMEYDVDALETYCPQSYPVREANRNSSLQRLRALQQSPADQVCYLDNDVYVVNNEFRRGFDIAEKYGLCLPINPRSFIRGDGGDLEVGADVSDYDREQTEGMQYMTACNMGVMFYDRWHQTAKKFLDVLINEQTTHPSRGQAALARAINKSNWHPYVLAQQWCTCRKIPNPLAIHVGSKDGEMLRYWKEQYNVRS